MFRLPGAQLWHELIHHANKEVVKSLIAMKWKSKQRYFQKLTYD